MDIEEMKRSRVAAFDDVNWKKIIAVYDEDSNGLMDTSEFMFMVKDLMSLRDNSSNISLEDAVTTAREIASLFDFFGDFSGVDSKQLSKAANEGAFEAEQFTPAMFMSLCGDYNEDEDMPPAPTLKATASSSYDSTREEQHIRPIVAQALKNSLQRAQVRQDRASLEKPHSASSCEICFDDVPVNELWGGPSFKKDCGCNIHVCLSCLRDSARSQMLQGQRLTCPNMLSMNPPRRCTVALNEAFVALLFKSACPLCLNSTGPLVSCGCVLDLYHTFCVPCLKKHVSDSLASPACLPRCPRYAECRYDMEEPALRRVLTIKEHTAEGGAGEEGEAKSPDLEEALERWHSLRIMRLQTSWRSEQHQYTIHAHLLTIHI
jgi:hypothetical protein